ncbi:MAG: hypothetical protein U0L71_00860 [Eggerthellaceae bacterium]|nr:hypothetical protein [Eggerthellaceae bacterium]
MKLPIDVKAVIDEATNIDEAAKTPVSVTVYYDGTCSSDLAEHLARAYEAAAPHARVSFATLDDALACPFPGDDIAVIAAGFDERVGVAAASLRAVGVPAMVATTLPSLVGQIAQAAGCPIPEGDIVAAGGATVSAVKRLADGLRGKTPASGFAFDESEEPLPLDDERLGQLDERMGAWIIAASREKRLAFALAFPFVRRPLSTEAVGATSMQNAGVGLVVLLPGADMPVMTLNQAKMLLQIAAAYGQPMSLARVKELACVVGGAFAFRTVARQVAGIVPALGWAVKAAIGYAGTEAMGRAAIEYFENGGSVSGLAEVVGKARDAVAQGAGCAQSVAASVASAARAASPSMKDGGAQAAPAATEKEIRR